MPIPPEVMFHRFFQTLSVHRRQTYKGKADLDRVGLDGALLAGIQEMFNDALGNERADDPEITTHERFHFDYIDSDVENAIAFRHEGYSFIGITIPFVRTLWEGCGRLSEADAIVVSLGLDVTPQLKDGLKVLLFRTQLSYVVSHEYTHHIHGHVPREASEPEFLEEHDKDEIGGLDRQTLEADADGYAVYLVLTNLITGEERSKANSSLSIELKAPAIQEAVLLAAFVVAIGGHLLARPVWLVDRTNIYALSHPPQAARMNLIMHHVEMWSVQNRTHLRDWMTLSRFQVLMRGAAEALWGLNGAAAWAAQTEFCRSEDGTEYTKRLISRIDEYKRSL